MTKNPEHLEEMAFVLQGRDKATIICACIPSLGETFPLQDDLQQRLPELQFLSLDLRGKEYSSLCSAIVKFVPQGFLLSTPGKYVLNIYGLEEKFTAPDCPLCQQINFERETLFRTFPFSIILWGQPEVVDGLKKGAPDFWDWITYSYSFEAATSDMELAIRER